MKKAFALVLTIIMVFALALPAYADETETTPATVSLTIAGEATGHTYEAYQIFGGKINDKGVMTEITWGTGLKNTDALLEALKADTTNFGTDFANVTDADTVATAMKAWGDNGAKIDAFADLLKDYLADTPTDTATNDIVAGEATTTYTFDSLAPGYYLIKDQDGTVDEKNDFYTKFLIDVTTSTDVAVKGSVPTVTKQVSNTLDGDYSAAITNELNKTHYYMWEGTIPTDINDYDFYYYEFQDTLSSGLTFLRFEEIYIQTTSGKDWIYNAALDDAETEANEAIVTVRWYPGTEGVGTIDDNGTDGTIGLKWNDLKAVYGALATSDKIVVKYSAKLNDNAIVGGSGNKNEVELIFSNNPHDDSDKGQTPPVDPRVYTFGLEVTKRAGSETGNALAGAKFVLYQKFTEHVKNEETGETTSVLVPYYAVLTGSKITSWVKDMDDATVLTSGADGKIKFEGLQVGIGYFLHETEAPDGYNKLTADTQINITGYTTDDYEVATISYQVNGGTLKTTSGETAKAGLVTADVVNKEGATLPSTGGVGTTLFYVVGSLMVVAAVVLLVTKKRMSAQN